jgi:hypothetical protein
MSLPLEDTRPLRRTRSGPVGQCSTSTLVQVRVPLVQIATLIQFATSPTAAAYADDFSLTSVHEKSYSNLRSTELARTLQLALLSWTPSSNTQLHSVPNHAAQRIDFESKGQVEEVRLDIRDRRRQNAVPLAMHLLGSIRLLSPLHLVALPDVFSSPIPKVKPVLQLLLKTLL